MQNQLSRQNSSLMQPGKREDTKMEKGTTVILTIKPTKKSSLAKYLHFQILLSARNYTPSQMKLG